MKLKCELAYRETPVFRVGHFVLGSCHMWLFFITGCYKAKVWGLLNYFITRLWQCLYSDSDIILFLNPPPFFTFSCQPWPLISQLCPSKHRAKHELRIKCPCCGSSPLSATSSMHQVYVPIQEISVTLCLEKQMEHFVVKNSKELMSLIPKKGPYSGLITLLMLVKIQHLCFLNIVCW